MKDWFYAFFMAWGMFLAIPCPFPRWRESARGRMLVCLPLIGLVEGGLWALEQPDVPMKPLIRRALDAYAQGRPLERGPELEELLGWAGVEIEQRRDELRR